MRRKRQGRRGQTLVELALLLPPITLMMMLAVDVSRAFYTYIGLINAARVGAEYAVDPALANAASSTNAGTVVVDAAAGNNRIRSRILAEASGQGNGTLTRLVVPPDTITLAYPATAPYVSTAGLPWRSCYSYTVIVQKEFRFVTPVIGTLVNAGTGTLTMTAESRLRHNRIRPNMAPCP